MALLCVKFGRFTGVLNCFSFPSPLLQKEYFIGKFALQKQKQHGVKKRLVMFTLEDLDTDKDIWAWGNEPIYRNNQYVGSVTSAGYVEK